MLECVDYSSSRPAPAALVAAGKHAVGRYVGPGSAPKHLGPAERDALHAAGLGIFLLVEGAAGDAVRGFNMGFSHAQQARDAAAALGAPTSVPLYFAVDFDVTTGQWPAVVQYLRGAASVVGAARVGIYGGYHAIVWAARDGVAAWFFQTYAWSDIDHDGVTNWAPNNNIEQYHNGQTVAGANVDLCRSITANFGQWPPAGTRVPGEEDDMPVIVRVSETGAIWCTNGPHRFWYSDVAQLASALRVFGKVTADIIAIGAADLPALGLDVTTETQGGLVLTPEELAAIGTAAEQGAARGAASAIDGATLHTGTG